MHFFSWSVPKDMHRRCVIGLAILKTLIGGIDILGGNESVPTPIFLDETLIDPKAHACSINISSGPRFNETFFIPLQLHVTELLHLNQPAWWILEFGILICKTIKLVLDTVVVFYLFFLQCRPKGYDGSTVFSELWIVDHNILECIRLKSSISLIIT